MIHVVADKAASDSTYLVLTYVVRATYEIYQGNKSPRADQHAKLTVTIFRQAGIPEFTDCTTDKTISKCELPKACVLFMDGLTLPALNMRWNGDNFEVDVVTVGDEYVLGFSFEAPQKPSQLPPDTIHELSLLKTTHNKLARLGIQDVMQIPRDAKELRKMGFTPAQIRDLQNNLGF